MNRFILLFVFLVTFLHSDILTGLDIIQRDDFKLLHNQNIGLVVNHTSLNKNGVHILDLLLEYKNINVVSIFTPEHGLKGNFSAGEEINSSFDENSGIKIISLYGKKKQPTTDDLLGLDYIVFDIQDIGSRYYTYVSTLTYILKASSMAEIPVIILDRPNPLGRKIEGPIIDSKYYSFVGMHPIPIRHGLTIAELALMINGEGWLSSQNKAEIIIYEMENWNSDLGYFSISPSPNIPDFSTAFIYNGMCLLEGTNISEGRGSSAPFLLFGAPWMNSKLILEDMLKFNSPGVTFYQKTFKPISMEGAKHPKYKGELCYGIKIDVFDESAMDPLAISILTLKTIYKHHPNYFSFNNNNFIAKLYGSNKIKENILQDRSIQELINTWNNDAISFSLLRKPYLIY